MSSFLDSLSKVIDIINPILLFIVLISIISFLSYLRVKSEVFFSDMKSISNSLEKIADSGDNKNNNYYM